MNPGVFLTGDCVCDDSVEGVRLWARVELSNEPENSIGLAIYSREQACGSGICVL